MTSGVPSGYCDFLPRWTVLQNCELKKTPLPPPLPYAALVAILSQQEISAQINNSELNTIHHISPFFPVSKLWQWEKK